MDDRLLSTAADLVLDAPDARLRQKAMALMLSAFGIGLAGDIFERFGDAVVWAASAFSVILVAVGLLVLAFARQRAWIVSAASTVLVARRFLGLAWHRERIAFDRIEEIQLGGDTGAASANEALRRRSVNLVLTDTAPLLLRSFDSSREAEELASRLAILIGRPVSGTTPELEAWRLAGSSAPPNELRSVVSRRGNKLRVTIDPRGHRQQGLLFFIGSMLAIAVVGSAVLMLLLASSHQTEHDLAGLVAGSLLSMVASLVIVALLHRNRFGKPLTMHASPGRLDIRRPRWLGRPRELTFTAADAPRIEVDSKAGLRIEADGHELLLGHSLSRGELEWIVEAIRSALSGNQPAHPPEESRDTVDSDTVNDVSLETAASPDEERWSISRVVSLLFFFAMGGAALIGLLQSWWLILAILALVIVTLGYQNAVLWWRKRRRVRAGHDAASFAAHFTDLQLQPELLETIYRDLSQAGEWVSDVPVLPDDRLQRVYGYDVNGLHRPWVEMLAEIQGVEPPTDDELSDVETVEDLVRLLAA